MARAVDPATVIVVLATHLLCIGGLLHLVGRQMPPRCGTWPWAAGLMLFGSAYGVPLALGTANSSWVVLPTDVALMAAALCFRVGLGAHAARRRVGPTPQRPLVLLTGLILMLALATFARGVNTGVHGLPAVLGGTHAKVYCTWASLAAVLPAMTLLWMVFVRLSTQLAETATHDALTR